MAGSAGSRRSQGAPPRRLGHEVPRIFTPPLRELTPETSYGFHVIEFADVLGIVLFPWQRWLLIHMLELLEDGRLRFRTVVILVGRQNGKSTLAKVIVLWFMYVLNTRLVLGTAQDLDVAEGLWAETVEMAQEDEELADMIARVVQGNGKKTLELTNGSKYQTKAASRRGGRGKTAGVVLLDELREHQNFEAWAAITKTTLTLANALVIALSNAGDLKSMVLRHLRRMAHLALGDPDGIWDGTDDVAEEVPDELDGEDLDDLAIFEWSAPPGAEAGDREAWAAANPSMGHIAPLERGIASAYRTDPPEQFLTECLCQWPDFSKDGPFPPGQWEAGIDVDSRIAPDARRSFCVDVSWDRTWSSIAVAGWRTDSLMHTEVVANRAGLDWVVPWFADKDRAARNGGHMFVVVQAKGAPASSLIEDLNAIEHVTVIEWGGTDLSIGCGKYFDLVKLSGLREVEGSEPVRAGLCHLPQPPLNVAAGVAAMKPFGDAWVWNRAASTEDISPLFASTGAVWHALQAPAVVPESPYEHRDVMVV